MSSILCAVIMFGCNSGMLAGGTRIVPGQTIDIISLDLAIGMLVLTFEIYASLQSNNLYFPFAYGTVRRAKDRIERILSVITVMECATETHERLTIKTRVTMRLVILHTILTEPTVATLRLQPLPHTCSTTISEWIGP